MIILCSWLVQFSKWFEKLEEEAEQRETGEERNRGREMKMVLLVVVMMGRYREMGEHVILGFGVVGECGLLQDTGYIFSALRDSSKA